MGINISVMNGEYREHPDWDWVRQWSDREFFFWLLRPDAHTVVRDKEYGDMVGVRPLDIPQLRRDIEDSGWRNKARYLRLCDILEDEQWFVRVVL